MSVVKTNYYVVTCWEDGRCVSETRFDDQEESRRVFQSAMDSSLYSRVDWCYVEIDHWEK